MADGWIGVDLDSTLAQYTKWVSETYIGAPVPLMLARVKFWCEHGQRVKIFTARVAPSATTPEQRDTIIAAIHAWLAQHGLPALEVTAEKDFKMIELWDDRCVQVVPNVGMTVEEQAYIQSSAIVVALMEQSPFVGWRKSADKIATELHARAGLALDDNGRGKINLKV